MGIYMYISLLCVEEKERNRIYKDNERNRIYKDNIYIYLKGTKLHEFILILLFPVLINNYRVCTYSFLYSYFYINPPFISHNTRSSRIKIFHDYLFCFILYYM